MNTKWKIKYVDSEDELCAFMSKLSNFQQVRAKVMYFDVGHTSFTICYPKFKSEREGGANPIR